MFNHRLTILLFEKNDRGAKYSNVLVTPSTRSPNRLRSVPLVVLTNEETASAAEVFAGAIRDHCRGLVVGEYSEAAPQWRSFLSRLTKISRTWGKGTVQMPVALSEMDRGGIALLISTARLRTPAGDDFDGCGLRLPHAAILDQFLGPKVHGLKQIFWFEPSFRNTLPGNEIRSILRRKLDLCKPA
jgi:hypothetical protein